MAAPLFDVIRAAIVEALRDHRGNKNAAADSLGLGRSTLFRRINDLKIVPSEYEASILARDNTIEIERWDASKNQSTALRGRDWAALLLAPPRLSPLPYKVQYVENGHTQTLGFQSLYDATQQAKLSHAAGMIDVTVIDCASGTCFCVAGNGFRRLVEIAAPLLEQANRDREQNLKVRAIAEAHDQLRATETDKLKHLLSRIESNDTVQLQAVDDHVYAIAAADALPQGGPEKRLTLLDFAAAMNRYRKQRSELLGKLKHLMARLEAIDAEPEAEVVQAIAAG